MLTLNGVPGSNPSGTGASVVAPQQEHSPAPAFAGAGSAFHSRHRRAHLWQVDLIVARIEPVLGVAEGMLAVAAARRLADHHFVGLGGQRPPAALAPQTALAWTFAPGLLRSVRLLPLRRRHAGVV